jgi:hypothetical protein
LCQVTLKKQDAVGAERVDVIGVFLQSLRSGTKPTVSKESNANGSPWQFFFADLLAGAPKRTNQRIRIGY